MPSFISRRTPGATAALVILAAAGMAACAEDIGPRNYSPYSAGSIARVDEGVVVGTQPIRFGGYDNGAGTVGGAVVGGVVGSQFGGRYDHGTFGLLGALGGALAGNAIAKNANDRQGFNYTIRRRRDGALVQVAQADAYPIPQGTRVYVSYGDRVRVQPIAGGPPPAPPGYYRDAPPPGYYPPPRY